MESRSMSDVTEITQLRARYSWAYDEADIEAMMTLFTANPSVDLGDWGVWRGRDEVRAGFADQIEHHATLHSVGTMVVDVDGENAAAKMYVTVYHPPRGDDHPIRFVGRYFDTYARVGGEWLIDSIRLEQMWFAGY